MYTFNTCTCTFNAHSIYIVVLSFLFRFRVLCKNTSYQEEGQLYHKQSYSASLGNLPLPLSLLQFPPLSPSLSPTFLLSSLPLPPSLPPSSCVLSLAMLRVFAASPLRDVCAGMNYIMSQKFVHRDLAARNVLLNSNGQAKVCKFTPIHLTSLFLCPFSFSLSPSPFHSPLSFRLSSLSVYSPPLSPPLLLRSLSPSTPSPSL